MRPKIGCLLVLSYCLLLPGTSYGFNDPDWPCVQRKVARLSIGQMWSAALAPEDARWDGDAELVDLAARLAAQRTSIDDAKGLVLDFAGRSDDARMTLLFAAVFAKIEKDRSALIEGISRYARKQHGLALKIRDQRATLSQAKSSVKPDDYDRLDEIDALEDHLTWETRIYDERSQSLTYVCESPVLLEKRAFALAQIIQAHLKAQ